MVIIEIEHLRKHFKVLNRREGLVGSMRDLFSTDFRTVKAVDGISMKIEAGEVVGYIGPNGAGKSTTIKMMTGILKPTDGTLTVNGNVPFKNRQRNAQNIGVVFGQRTQLWWDLPLIESFKILKAIYRIPDDVYKTNMDIFNELVDLQKLYNKPVRQMSLGQRMLGDITAAFLHNPRVIFLDEPTIGLDISVKSNIRTLIRELNTKRNTTIILTTHDIGDIEALCRRVVIIDKGKLIYDDEMQKVNNMFGAYRTLKLEVFPLTPELVSAFTAKVNQNFKYPEAFEITSDEDGWISVTINQDKVPLRDVLNFAMSDLPVKDVKIAEIATESVIQKIYEGTAIAGDKEGKVDVESEPQGVATP
jgi:ABC-2 type transport system ATP-binding protein